MVEYNSEQLRAIGHNNGPALVLAGAGTGKTAVITARITRLIIQAKTPADQILALTFTEKSAREMQQRVDESLPYGYVQTNIMTFHALAEQILREFALDVGLSSDYQIISTAQQSVMMQDILSKVSFNYYTPLHQPYMFSQALLAAISRLKDEAIDPARFKSLIQRSSVDAESKQRYGEVYECYKAYQAALKQKNFLDFGDLLYNLQLLLHTRKNVQQEVTNRFRYVLVDEFQDTNKIQLNILKLLLNKQQNLMVVGDDDQAIYKFRGASVKNILEFQKLFKNSQLMLLTQNYRSGQAILDSSHQLIQHNNPDRLEYIENISKKLEAWEKDTGSVVYRSHSHKLDEQSWLIGEVTKLLKNGVESNSIAILLRKNSQIKPYILALQKNNLEVYVHQSLDLFQQKVVKMLLALCSGLSNPHDNQAIYQLLSSSLFKIDTNELIGVSAKARSVHESIAEYINQNPDLVSCELTTAIGEITKWRGDSKLLSAGELIYSVLQESKLLQKLLKKAQDDNVAASDVQLIAEFFTLVKDFELASEFTDLVSFSHFLSDLRSSEADIFADVSPLDVSGVQIMTVHRAKGLEFEYVFLPELNEQIFPTYSRSDSVKLDAILQKTEKGDHYQEERRLFYVAMTRAKEGLYLSSASDHGGKRAKKTSRFVFEALGNDLSTRSAQPNQQTSLAEFLGSFAPLQKQPGRDLTQHLYSDDWLRLTTNQVADYLRSPREFWVFQVLKMPKGPFYALTYGSALHAALEQYYRAIIDGKRPTLGKMKQAFDQSWSHEGFVSSEQNKTLYTKGLKAIDDYFALHKTSANKPICVEKPFELHLPELKTVITGRYDVVFADNDQIEIRDFKTSEVKTAKAADKRARDSIQLGIYALAWEKIQQQSVGKTSLEFVNNNIIGENAKIDHAKTLQCITQTAEGIKQLAFEDKGASRINFERLLP